MMTNLFSQINWIAVLIAFVVYFVLGALWFTLFFSKQYKISLGREKNEVLPGKPIFIVGPALCSLVITIASAVLMHSLHIESFADAITFALVVGIGYLVSNTVNIAINPNIPRPIHYGIISGSYHQAGILIVCIILVAMN